MSDSKNKFHVGQQLYWVYDNSRMGSNGFVTVESVGRKWIGIGRRRRISAETMRHDGGDYSSYGRCYFTKEEHDAIVERGRAWSALQHLMRNTLGIPDHITTEQIRSAIALLEPPKESP